MYGENAVVHMMSGKSVQRAFRGHLLVDKCLHQMIVVSAVEADPDFATKVDDIEEMYLSLLKGDTSLEIMTQSTVITQVTDALEKRKSELENNPKVVSCGWGIRRCFILLEQ